MANGPHVDFPDDLVDTFEAAKLTKLNVQVVRRWLRTGKIEGWRIARRWYVSKAELMSHWKTSGEIVAEQAAERGPLPSTRRELSRREKAAYQKLRDMGMKV
jgi:excisionase family DNA binding protein